MKRLNHIISIIVIVTFSMLLTDCTRCSQSGRNAANREKGQQNASTSSRNFEKNVIKMQHENGVYKVPIFINDTKMIFIFDTGASDITISATEAMFLYKQGTLRQEDILGTQKYQIADGSITEGTVINLRTVQIGNKILTNVNASVVHNGEAPLLLGQSALAQFGKVSIDYKRNEITFE